ncbi:endonuclease III [Candidatus Micrarchaeota archaeon]|nr:endonuclease III [Candidatus Micrarchaeota archaeon]
MEKDRIRETVARLKKYYSTLVSHLGGMEENPFEILISTVLSQRTKDANTERATEALFSVYRTPEEIAKAPLKRIEKLIYGSGFYKTKAKRVKRISTQLIERFGGKVPADIESLLSLPGVGRKTANCVLVYAYRVPSIPVDTHVHRISNRLGWVKTKAPEKTEEELVKIIPRDLWIEINELFVLHGQNICLPRKPLCFKCPVESLCECPFKNLYSDSEKAS